MLTDKRGICLKETCMRDDEDLKIIPCVYNANQQVKTNYIIRKICMKKRWGCEKV